MPEIILNNDFNNTAIPENQENPVWQAEGGNGARWSGGVVLLATVLKPVVLSGPVDSGFSISQEIRT